MKIEQIQKILFTAIIATALMFGFELLFDIPVISDWIRNLVASQSTWVVYIILWLLMFIQVAFVPIPAVVVLTASIGAGILDTSLGLGMFTLGKTWLFIIVVLSAYMLGAVVAYWIGRKWGKKAVLWCAGEESEYTKWSAFLNKDQAKWIYAGTVILPVFPDDLLCLVCGAVKFNFGFFFISNLIGRGIGLICMLASLAIIGAGGGSPLALIAWGSALVIEIILYIILKVKYKKNIL